MSAQHEQINPLRMLGKHAERIAKEHGLILRHFSVLPALDDGLDKATIVMEFDPEAEKQPEVVIEQANAALTEAMLKAQKEALEERAAEARKDIEKMLRDRLSGGGGFLDPQ